MKLANDDTDNLDNASTESSRRNSLREECRPTELAIPLQDLLVCHFGQNFQYNGAPFKAIDD